jgi:hypothetical protein
MFAEVRKRLEKKHGLEKYKIWKYIPISQKGPVYKGSVLKVEKNDLGPVWII